MHDLVHVLVVFECILKLKVRSHGEHDVVCGVVFDLVINGFREVFDSFWDVVAVQVKVVL